MNRAMLLGITVSQLSRLKGALATSSDPRTHTTDVHRSTAIARPLLDIYKPQEIMVIERSMQPRNATQKCDPEMISCNHCLAIVWIYNRSGPEV